MTAEQNTLALSVQTGHALRHREIDPAAYAAEDRWFHYNQVGSVMSESDTTGALATHHYRTAFGVVLDDWQTGLPGGERSGWHHNILNQGEG